MPPALLIIADDLTGANDTGVQFAKQGLRVIVSIHHDQPLTALAHDCQVLVVNTESRHLSPKAAFARVYQTTAQGVALGIQQFYKKTDSTLRGNIGSELAALLAATGERELFFAPAYPKLKRTTRNGFHYVDDIPLSDSSFASDALNPLRDDFVPALIARQTDLPVTVCNVDTPPEQAQNQIIHVMDAATDEELQAVAQLLKAKKLLAGSAGFAECLPAIMRFALTPTLPASLSLPMLIVNGSRHEVSLRQVADAAQHGWAVIEATVATTPVQIVATLARQPRVILTTVPQLVDAQFAMRFATLVRQTLAQSAVASLAIFGGDTLSVIADACGWQAFRPYAEFLPGIPLVEICGQESLQLLTKAGGFGGVDLLTNI